MGSGNGGRKQRRKQREREIADAIVDRRVTKSAQERTLGTAVDSQVPDSSLFVLDRTKLSRKQIVAEERLTNAILRKQRRGAPKVRRSERSAVAGGGSVPMTAVSCPGKKAKRGVASVDMNIIQRRDFPMKGVEKTIKKRAGPAKMDLWEARDGTESKSKTRKAVEVKMNLAVKTSTQVLVPGDGMSINPTLEAHQDALGEAVAEDVARKDRERWISESLRFDPAVLREPDIQVADDQSDSDSNGGEEEGRSADPVARVFPERKTRRERNKDSRRRQAEAVRARKLARVQQLMQIDHLEQIQEEAALEARRLEGVDAAERKKANEEARKLDANLEAAPVHAALGGCAVPSEKMVDSAAVPLSSDLAENLRQVRMPGENPLLKERFLSTQRRGLIEPPDVIKKEKKQAKKDKRRAELKDPLIRKGRGAASKLTYWRKPRKR